MWRWYIYSKEGKKTREKGKNKVGRSSESTAYRFLQREGDTERHRGEEGDPTLPTLAQPRSPSKLYVCMPHPPVLPP